MTPDKPTTRPRRWRRLLIAAPVAVVALVAGVLWYDDYRGKRAWAEACAEADRLDPGWRWADLAARRPELPADRDAARVLLAAAAKRPAGWPHWVVALREVDVPAGQRAAPGDRPTDVEPATPPTPEERRQLEVQGLENSLGDLPRNHRLTPAQRFALRAVMPAVTEARQESLRLTDLTPGRSADSGKRPLMFHLPTGDFQKPREVTIMLNLHAVLAADEGRIDEALADGRAMLGVARAATEPPTLIAALVASALNHVAVGSMSRTLGQGEPSGDALAAAQRDVQAALASPLFLDALRGERAMLEDLIVALDKGLLTRDQVAQLDFGGVRAVTGSPAVDRWLHRLLGTGFRKVHGASVVRFYTTVIELLKESPDAPMRRQGEVSAARDRLPSAAGSWVNLVDKVLDLDRRQRGLLAALTAALAAERFRRDTDRWPESLAELTPTYLKAVPTDPFSLEPLRYKRLSDGVVIYAVGPDQTDSGGEVWVPGRLPTDIGVRLWDVSHRRQPPPTDGMKEP